MNKDPNSCGERVRCLVYGLGLSPAKLEKASRGQFQAYQVQNWIKGSIPNVVDGEAFVLWLRGFNSKRGASALPLAWFSVAHIWGNVDSHEDKDSASETEKQRRAS